MHGSAHSSTRAWLSAFPRLATITDAAWLSASDAAQMMDFPPGTIMMRPGGVQPGFHPARKGLCAGL